MNKRGRDKKNVLPPCNCGCVYTNDRKGFKTQNQVIDDHRYMDCINFNDCKKGLDWTIHSTF